MPPAFAQDAVPPHQESGNKYGRRTEAGDHPDHLDGPAAKVPEMQTAKPRKNSVAELRIRWPADLQNRGREGIQIDRRGLMAIIGAIRMS